MNQDGGCSQCSILAEVNRSLETRFANERGAAIERLVGSGVAVSAIAHAYKLPPETVEAIAKARAKT